MTAERQAEEAARKIAALINSPLIRGYDPLSAIPTDRTAALSSGEKALLRVARNVDDIGVDLGRVDHVTRAEAGAALVEFGGYLIGASDG